MEKITKQKIEVEMRGLLNKKQFFVLKKKIETECLFFEEDNKISYFFIVTGFVLKVNNETSKDSGVVILKIGHETGNIFEEVYFKFNNNFVDDMIKIFKSLGFEKINKVPQIRYNYLLKNGIQLSLKYTPDFGYHFEIESIVNSSKKINKTKKLLTNFCQKHFLTPLNEDDMKKIIIKINKKHKFLK